MVERLSHTQKVEGSIPSQFINRENLTGFLWYSIMAICLVVDQVIRVRFPVLEYSDIVHTIFTGLWGLNSVGRVYDS